MRGLHLLLGILTLGFPNSAIAGDLTSPPRFVGCGSRFYPASAVEAHEEGDTVITVAIDDAGKVTNVQVDHSSGFDDLDQAAVQCVEQAWHFSPATLNDKPVSSTKHYKIFWRLNQSQSETH